MSFAEMLCEELEDEAGPTIYARGKRYAAGGRVRSIVKTRSGDIIDIKAKVQGSGMYRSTLSFDGTSGEIGGYDCSCPYDYGICKHVVALGLSYARQIDTQAEAEAPADDRADEATAMRAKLKAAGIPEVNISPEIIAELVRAVRLDPPKTPAQNWQHKGGVWTSIGKEVAEKKPPTPKPPKSRKPFRERYDLSISTRYDGVIGSAQLEKREQKRPQHYWYQEPRVSAADLLKEERDLSEAQREMLAILAQADTKRSNTRGYLEENDPDCPLLLKTAREGNMRILHEAAYSSHKTELRWREAEKLTARLSLENRASEIYSLQSTHRYQVIALSIPAFDKARDAGAAAGENGVAVIDNGTVGIYAMPRTLARLVARVIRSSRVDPYDRRSVLQKRAAKADLLDEDYEYLNDILVDARQHLYTDAALPEKFEIVRHDPKAVILIDYAEAERKLAVLPSVDYGGAVLPVSETIQLSPNASGGCKRRQIGAFGASSVVRIDGDTVHIAPVAEALERELFKLGAPEHQGRLGLSRTGRRLLRGGQVAPFIERHVSEIRKLPYEMRYIRDAVPDITTAGMRAEFDIDLDAGNDWLAFDLALYCGDERITLSDLEAFAGSGGDLLKTKDGRVFRITNPESVKRLLELLESFRKKSDGSFEGRAYHAPALSADAASSPHYSAKLSKSFQTFMREAQSGGKAVRAGKLPPPFSTTLRDYQRDGVAWMRFLRRCRFGGILADDMGTGKTLQALATLSMHRAAGKPSLVIAPKTLLYNWEREARTFAPHLKIAIVAGSPAERAALLRSARRYDVLVTSYPLLQKDLAQYEKLAFNYCVLDEAQYVKNPRTRGAHAVKKVRSDYRLALTGTPLENSTEELWSVFDFLMPDFLGRHAHFQRRFGIPIMKRGDAAAIARLRERVGCFMLRRTKDEVLKELPPKIEQAIESELSDAQNILYQEVLARVRSDIFGEVKRKGFAASQIHILAGLTRLRQICNHPALVLKKKRGDYPSAKLDACMELVEELHSEGRKVLIFSQFTRMLDIIKAQLARRGIGHAYLSGATATKRRSAIIDSFACDPKQTAFLISTKAGGVGLNLVAADTVIIFDPWWNPQVERQAIDRAHRIGQTKSVNVYRLRTKGTIEEKIAGLQERKRKLFDSLVGESKDAFAKLTWDDVRQLLAQ